MKRLLILFGLRQRLLDWLETRWVNPDYKGWLLMVLALFFFLAASNTMAGWLYVMSGVSLALLAIAVYLTRRSLKDLKVIRSPLPAVSVGQWLSIELTVLNPGRQVKSLLQLQDQLPPDLGSTEEAAIALIGPGKEHCYRYRRLAQTRGYHRWETVALRSGAPLGLFWYRRSLPTQGRAIIYPHIVPLTRCPLVDALGQERNPNLQQIQRSQAAPEGLTRALRPYRWGDPIRMVHWRTSARYGELRVRELETLQAGQEVLLAIDSAGQWQPLPDWEPEAGIAVGVGQVNTFEHAVTALASLYRYASRYQERVRVWTAATGAVNGDRRILQTLAALEPGEPSSHELPRQPVIWLTQNPATLAQLPAGSRWLLWPGTMTSAPPPTRTVTSTGPNSGLAINPSEPLQSQLQSALI